MERMRACGTLLNDSGYRLTLEVRLKAIDTDDSNSKGGCPLQALNEHRNGSADERVALQIKHQLFLI